MFKSRYLRSFRNLDSHYFLKILIIFNVFLGLYLLFLSTNYRRSAQYPRDNKPSESALIVSKNNNDKNNNQTDFVFPNKSLPNVNDAKISNEKSETNSKNDPTIDQPNELNEDKTNNRIVDKLYDSNNQPVQVQDGVNNADSSYKRVEEDEKTIDENDKLRIEMLGAKPDEQNSIIHSDLEIPENKNKKITDANSKNNAKEAINDDLSKDVINQIMDHNSHIKKNSSKLIIPENINMELRTPEKRGKYLVLRDYITGNAPIESRTITLTTQGGPGFLHHVEELCSRWDGPISLSVYAPGDDFRLSINMIYYLRQCANKCIADRVFWHLVYDVTYPPSTKISGPTSFLEQQSFDCNISLDETMRLLKIDSDFRKDKSLPYPINVLRNVARLSSKSKYLLASDIELYPSVGIIPAFFDLLEREKKNMTPIINSSLPHVYTLPIFEVKADKKPPRTKQDLSKLFKAKDAIFFHRYVCDLCQNFPDRNIWINEIPPDNTLNVFRKTKRTRERSQWEPLYIGTNDEPLYDERLTWEGKRDKMSQMYHMCLLNYDMLILDNAFLVHAPGIKRYNVKDDKKRLTYIIANHKIYTSVLANLRKKYGTKNHC